MSTHDEVIAELRAQIETLTAEKEAAVKRAEEIETHCDEHLDALNTVEGAWGDIKRQLAAAESLAASYRLALEGVKVWLETPAGSGPLWQRKSLDEQDAIQGIYRAILAALRAGDGAKGGGE